MSSGDSVFISSTSQYMNELFCVQVSIWFGEGI